MQKKFNHPKFKYCRKYLYVFIATFFFFLLSGLGKVSAQHSQTICSGSSISFAPAGNPSSLTYTWGVPVVSPAGALNATPQATPQTAVIQTLINNTTAAATATYSVRASDASTFTLVVTVNPKPVLSNSTATSSICSGATFAYTAASATTGTTITWTRAASTGITPATNNGTGNISEALTNTTDNPVTATYLLSLTANGCSNVQNLSVQVNPNPSLNSTLTPADVCSGSVFSYSPSSSQSDITFSWSRSAVAGISNGAATGTGSPEEILVNTTLAPVPVIYLYTLKSTATACSSTQTVTVNVNPQPALSSSTSNVILCSGTTFNYSPSSALAGASITWSRASVVGISPASGLGNGNISEVLVNNSNTAAVTAVYEFTLSKLGCTRTQSFSVTVNPSPALTSALVTNNICSGNPFTYNPSSAQSNITFDWSRAAVAGISNTAATGTGNPNETLTNTTLLSVGVIYSYKLTNTVTGCVNTQNVSFNVNPIPAISSPINVSTCNSQGFITYPSGAPVGTTYTWPTPVVTPFGAVTGGSAQSTGLGYVGQSLSNNTGSPATITYTVTPNTFGCIGSTFSVVVTVNTGVAPSISLSSSLSPPAICSGTKFNYIPTSEAPSPTFSWQRLYAAGISNPINSGTNDPNETLTNTTTLPVTVSYGFTVSSGGCSSTQIVQVQVNPATSLSSTLTPTPVCSNTLFSYTPTSNTPSTISYLWTRSVKAGISNAAASGSNSPNEVLLNTTANPITVNYVYTLNTSGSCSNTQTVSVIVNPTPTFTSALSATAICSGGTVNYIPTSSTTGTVYTWSRAVVAGISNLSQTGVDNPGEVLMNTSLSEITVAYNYTLTANTCSNTQTVTVLVKPIPVVANKTAVICSGTSFTTAPTGVPSGTQYTWALPTSVPAGAVVGGSAGVLQNTISQLLNNSTLDQGILYYTVTPVANGCSGLDFTVAVTVNPIPVTTNQVLTAICSGTAFNYNPTGIATGTTYSWNSPVLSPVFSITGASAQTAQTSIGQTLTNQNTSLSTVTYTVTPVANGCTGNNFTVTVPVNPVPSVSTQSASICSDNSFTVTPTSVPASTNYTWTTPVTTPSGAVSAAVAQNTPVLSISQLLSNTTTNTAQTIYTVTPITGTCAGSNFTVNVTVNPSTQLTLPLNAAAICSNTQFSYNAASNTSGTTIQWTRALVTGISNIAATGINNPNETLINITNQPITVSYIYHLSTAPGCTNTQTVTVSVKPQPLLNSVTLAPAVCSGTPLSYQPTSNVSGASFSWSRIAQAFISNVAATGINDPAEILVNTSVNTVPVDYTYTISANGCSSQQTITIPVKPTPNLSNQTASTCSNTAFSFSSGAVPTGTTYTWSAPVYTPAVSLTGGTSQLVGQTVVSQQLTSQTLASAVATYTVTASAGGCSSVPFTLAVTVKPVPVVSNQLLAQVCSGVAFGLTPSGVPAGTTYIWDNPLVTPANSLSGGSAQSTGLLSIGQTLSSTNNVVNTAVYTITPSFNGCIGNNFTLTVPVNPTPVIADIKDTICTGSAFMVAPTSTPINTRYTWATPTVQPFGALAGYSAQSTPTGNISQTLINTTNSSARVLYTITPIAGNCSGAPFSLVVNVGANLPFLADQSAQICSGSTFNATPVNAPAGTTYTWQLPVVTPAGSVSGISNAPFPETAVSQLLKNGTFANAVATYSVTAKNTGCISNTFKATVTVLPIPKITVTGNPVICRYPYDTLTVHFVSGTPSWSFSYAEDNLAPQTVTGIGNTPYQLVVPASSQSTRRFSFTNIAFGSCLNTADTTYFSQLINPLPVGTLHTQRGIYLCNNIPDTLFITSPDSLGYRWQLNGTPLTGFTDDSLVTGVPGRYNAAITNKFGCTDTVSNPITLYKVNPVVPRLLYDTYCVNIPLNFTNITDTNTTGPINWQWDFGDGNSQNGFHGVNVYTTGGNHHVRLMATQVYCPATPTTLDTTIDLQIPIPGVTMPSLSAYKTVPLPASVRSIPGYRYRWTPSKGINLPDSANVIFNHTTTQQYVVNLISKAGCVTNDSLLIRVFDDKLVDIFLPKSFTPNNDGINDKLFPYLAGIKEFRYYRIFNRFNQLLFESKNYDEGWNGTLNGVPQPMGIYIWVAVGVKEDGSLLQKTGQTLLLR